MRWPPPTSVGGVSVEVLALINAAAAAASNQEQSAREAVLFVIVVTMYYLSQRHVMLTTTREIEGVLGWIRIRLSDKIRHCDLRPLEEIDCASIYSSIQHIARDASSSAALRSL